MSEKVEPLVHINTKPERTEFLLKPGNANPLVSDIRKTIGATETEKIVVHTPQFERRSGRRPPVTPSTVEEYDALKRLDRETLRLYCLGLWGLGVAMEGGSYNMDEEDDEKCDSEIWLYPGEWFDSIPDGYPVVGLFGKATLFDRATADDDIRFGCLPYGFGRPKTREARDE